MWGFSLQPPHLLPNNIQIHILFLTNSSPFCWSRLWHWIPWYSLFLYSLRPKTYLPPIPSPSPGHEGSFSLESPFYLIMQQTCKSWGHGKKVESGKNFNLSNSHIFILIWRNISQMRSMHFTHSSFHPLFIGLLNSHNY